MHTSRQIGWMIVVAVWMAGAVRAQTSTPNVQVNPAGSSSSQPSNSLPADVDTEPQTTPQTTPAPTEEPVPATTGNLPQTVYVPALDGTGLIALDHSVRSRYLYGANYSGGFDSNPNDLTQGPSSATYLFSPFVGLQANLENVQYVLQYQPTFRKYGNDQYQGGSLQSASAKVTGNVNERWVWDVDAVGSHGQDSIRLLAPSQSVAVGDVPATGSGSASYRPGAGTITYINGEIGLKLNASERDSVAFNLVNQFSNYGGLQGESNIATATVAYTRSVTPKFQWINYGQSARYYGFIHCFSYGGGVGLEWKPGEHSFLHLSGGPQVDSSGCGKQQGYAYDAQYSARVTSKSQIYFTSTRENANSYLGPGLWQKTATVGYQHDFDKDQSVVVDFGYVGTTSLEGVPGYSGTYADAQYLHRFGRSFSAGLSYRRYTGDWTDTSFTRNTALLSVSWTPSAGHVFQ